MSDRRVRELERQVTLGSGHEHRSALVTERLRRGARFDDLPAEDQAVVLRDRLDQGTLATEGLALAAWAGHRGARALLPGTPARELVATRTALDLREVVRDVAELGPLARRAALAGVARAAAERCDPTLREAPAHDDHDADGPDARDLPMELADAVAAWATAGEPPLARWTAPLLTRLSDRAAELHQVGAAWDAVATRGWDCLRRLEEPRGAEDVLDLVDRLLGTGLYETDDLVDLDDDALDELLWPAVRRLVTHLSSALVAAGLAPVRLRRSRAYSPRDLLAAGDVVEHPKFGRGTVTRAAAKQVEVSFDDGVVRKLAHGL